MQQFQSAWAFFLNNFSLLVLIVLPVAVLESGIGYLIVPLENMAPEDMLEYLSGNATPLAVLGLISMVLVVALPGALVVAFNNIMEKQPIFFIDALTAGIKKFFPLLLASILATLAVFVGFLLLVLPAFYFMGRLYLFPSYVMLEGMGATAALSKSWEVTDPHGGRLFLLTPVFFTLSIGLATLLTSFVFADNVIGSIVSAALVEYLILIPWSFVYFSLYKSLQPVTHIEETTTEENIGDDTDSF